jgi:DNA-binding NtrC family response regulator
VNKALMQSEERVNTIMFVSGRKPEAIVEHELQRQGLNVKWANSIKAATDLLDSESEGIGIVTELALADGNWRDLVEHARSVSTTIPVVLMTSTSTAELWWDALDCDVEEILPIPLSASRLCEVMGLDPIDV